MRQRVIVYNKWEAEIVEEGAEQSILRVLDDEAPGYMRDKPLCFVNGDFKKMKERKNSGPEKPSDYSKRAGAKPGRPQMRTDEEAGPTLEAAGEEASGVDYLTQYNELVAEAKSIGMNAKPIKTNFRDEETGAKRCEALAEAIEAHKAKVASGEEAAPQESEEPQAELPDPPPPDQERKKMAKTATAKKAKKAATPKKGAAKKAAAAPKKAAAEPRKNAPAAAIEFGTREGTNREAAVLYLVKHKNKEVTLADLAKEVYGKNDDESRLKAKAVIVGMNMMIDKNNLSYKPVEFSGRGEDATLVLATKSGR